MAYQTKFDGSTDKTIKLGGAGNPSSLEGYFLGSKDTQSDFGPGKLHIFQTEEGTVGVWGKTRMNGLLTKDLIGQMVLVSFTGMVPPSKKGRQPSYGYKVQHDPSNVIDTSGVNLKAATASDDDSESESYDSEGSTETFEEEAPVVHAPPKAPARPASTPSAERAAQVQALLNKNRARA